MVRLHVPWCKPALSALCVATWQTWRGNQCQIIFIVPTNVTPGLGFSSPLLPSAQLTRSEGPFSASLHRVSPQTPFAVSHPFHPSSPLHVCLLVVGQRRREIMEYEYGGVRSGGTYDVGRPSMYQARPDSRDRGNAHSNNNSSSFYPRISQQQSLGGQSMSRAPPPQPGPAANSGNPCEFFFSPIRQTLTSELRQFLEYA